MCTTPNLCLWAGLSGLHTHAAAPLIALIKASASLDVWPGLDYISRRFLCFWPSKHPAFKSSFGRQLMSSSRLTALFHVQGGTATTHGLPEREDEQPGRAGMSGATIVKDGNGANTPTADWTRQNHCTNWCLGAMLGPSMRIQTQAY